MIDASLLYPKNSCAISLVKDIYQSWLKLQQRLEYELQGQDP